jgi:transketolase
MSWRGINMAKLKAIRDAFGEALLKIGGENKNIVVLEADVGSSSKSILFGNEYPERYFNVGIAEGNMAAMAAGFATTGKIPFINTFAAFMALRSGDPINSLIAYSNMNVKLAGTYAGLSDSYDGASHHAISDISLMRALPNMVVISVADAVETEKATKAAAEYNGPVYLRLSRAPVPIIFDESYNFEIGKGVQLTEGNDVSIIATGYMVQKSLEAAEELKAKGINARVINIHTIKPIDIELIVKCAKETGVIVTAEEHNVIGGLGSAVAEVLVKEYPVPMEFVGVQDEFAESGDYEMLLEKYGLGTKSIIDKVESVISKK